MHCREIPDQAYRALKLPPKRADGELQRELAAALVKEGLLTPSHARLIAKMDRLAFNDLPAQRHVAWGSCANDVMEDVATASRSQAALLIIDDMAGGASPSVWAEDHRHLRRGACGG